MILTSMFKNKIDTLKKQSDGYAAMFTTALNNLSAVNQEIEIEVKKRNDQIAALDKEITELAVVKDKNELIFSNVDKILNQILKTE